MSKVTSGDVEQTSRHRDHRGREREVLRRPGRRGRRRRLGLLDGARVRARAGRLGRLRPGRHRHLPEEGRGRDHQPDRRDLRPDLGDRVPAGLPRPAGTATELEPGQVVAMLRAAIEGIKARGHSDVGDKTLLDALVPARVTRSRRVRGGRLGGAVAEGRRPGRPRTAEATRPMHAQARPGRLHRRAVHRHARRRCRRGRRHVRGARRRGAARDVSRRL